MDPVISSLLVDADVARSRTNAELHEGSRSSLGQFMTPGVVAALMASMFGDLGRDIRLLDAGAGVGSLTAALVHELANRPNPPSAIHATAFELDPVMIASLRTVITKCGTFARRANIQFHGQVVDGDFLAHASDLLEANLFRANTAPTFNAAILNPPYRKIASSSNERRLLRAAGIETTNLYAGFVALAIRLLEPGGELVAITPRSFCNGPYFRAFRRLLLDEMSLQRVHVFESRNRAFRDDAVLQENIIFHAKKRTRRTRVILSTSAAPGEPVSSRSVPYAHVVAPDDPNAFIHLAVTEDDGSIAARITSLPCSLEDLGLTASTGRVVDFRAREFLRDKPGPRTVPLLYPTHFERGFIAWPKLDSRKPNALVDTVATQSLMVPNGVYVLTKRFTSKEERRRIVAAVIDPARLPESVEQLGIENHVNYFHLAGRPLPMRLAKGLAAYLNCTAVDRYFRQFNGHTQVNAGDLRSLRYPNRDTLDALGRRIGREFPDQESRDEIVDGELPPPKSSARSVNQRRTSARTTCSSGFAPACGSLNHHVRLSPTAEWAGAVSDDALEFGVIADGARGAW